MKNLEYDKENQEFWNAHYYKFYKEIYENKEWDNFVLSCLSGLENEKVQSKVDSKMKKIRSFIKNIFQNFNPLL